ncbi:MAG: fluoride efflux transporter CrcB [Motilibacteraceae bacterium]
MLPIKERLALARLERQLRRDDPAFARRMNRTTTASPDRRPFSTTSLLCGVLTVVLSAAFLLASGLRLTAPLLAALALTLLALTLVPSSAVGWRLRRGLRARLWHGHGAYEHRATDRIGDLPQRPEVAEVADPALDLTVTAQAPAVLAAPSTGGDVAATPEQAASTESPQAPPPGGREPVDPDVDLHVPAQRRQRQAPAVAVIAAGGALGAEARYGLSLAMPHGPAQFPWATLVTNALGCLLIGVLMVLVTEVLSTHRLVRPFLGTGVLGGFTTFSTYTVDTQRLLTEGKAGLALTYLAATLAAAMVAVWLGANTTRITVDRFTDRERRPA